MKRRRQDRANAKFTALSVSIARQGLEAAQARRNESEAKAKPSGTSEAGSTPPSQPPAAGSDPEPAPPPKSSGTGGAGSSWEPVPKAPSPPPAAEPKPTEPPNVPSSSKAVPISLNRPFPGHRGVMDLRPNNVPTFKAPPMSILRPPPKAVPKGRVLTNAEFDALVQAQREEDERATLLVLEQEEARLEAARSEAAEAARRLAEHL